MSIESVIGIIAGLIAIGGAVISLYKKLKKRPLTELMNQLVAKKLSSKQHRTILRKMSIQLGGKIKNEYIQKFVLNDRGKEAVFMDICESNEIEPTEEICKKFMNADMKKFRADYNSRRNNTIPSFKSEKTQTFPSSLDNEGQTVYMSELLMSRYPETCKNLIKALEKHKVNYSFIKSTKDIWCRDYMPVQTASGKLIQFRYDPSYLKGKKEWEESRSDVKEICEKNNIVATESDINLDGGNVLICDGRAIISDRIYSENPDKTREELRKELALLLECEIIVIPSLNKTADFTGHADGMVRFVDRNTVLGIKYDDRYKKDWWKNTQKVLDTYNISFIEVPFFEDEPDSEHPESAIGVYVNYLEVNDLIVVPVFGREEDARAIEIIQKAFPNKQIETINYNDVAKEGGLLNCTTWVVK
ncbi:MAG: agmatine deiminase family protein [Bacteroidales bacterium]|nr:agmatine deiminase family protein [Bacteroidales bacterium]MBR6991455.1 agmatine deiminase family protein [Bacteroidales bacterium]